MTASHGSRAHGDGGMDERSPGHFRLRYRVDGKRFSVASRHDRRGSEGTAPADQVGRRWPACCARPSRARGVFARLA